MAHDVMRTNQARLLLLRIAPAALLLGLWGWTTVSIFPLSPDSTCYLDVAHNLAERGRLVVHKTVFPEIPGLFVTDCATGLARLTWWPPLMPVILSLFIRAGLDPVGAILALNAVLLLATWLVSAHLFDQVVFPVPSGWVAAAILSYPPVLQAHAFVWSEPLALALTVFAISTAVHTDRPGPWAGAAGLLAGLGATCRFTGLALVASLIAALAIRGLLRSRRQALAWGGWVLGGALLGGGWFYARNLLEFGTPFAYTLPRGGQALYPLVCQASREIFVAFLPIRSVAMRLARWEVMLAALAVLLVYVLLRRRRRAAARSGDHRTLDLVCALFVAVFVVQVIAANVRHDIQDGLEHRHAVLIVVPLYLLLARALSGPTGVWTRRILGAAVLLLLVGHVVEAGVWNSREANRKDAISRMKAEAPLSGLRRVIPPEAGVVTNNQVLGHYYLRRRVTEPTHRLHHHVPPEDYGLAMRAEGMRFLLWFKEGVPRKIPRDQAEFYDELSRGLHLGETRVIADNPYWRLLEIQ